MALRMASRTGALASLKAQAKRRQSAHDAAANASRGAGKLLVNAPGPRFQRENRRKPDEEKTTRPNEKSAFSLGNTFFLQ
ncbi:MAG: hypothetical protein CVU30_07055 [Betaproteobacteria bacterium HGW-Betaproteobacteria-3]|jgi:hypothetical protein|nr:MAG: hypothetical protein CVU30_07055 [Betaproteobacteria bacterium HGW-Betaproteobacteria-3]